MAGHSTIGKPRASVQRVRTGCITCKIRRVRCDEAQPSCLRCSRTGRKCDGYDPELIRSQGSSFVRDALRTPRSARAPAAPLIYCIPFKIPGSQSDRQLLHYYCVYASRELSEYPATSFWTETVLQWSHQEPVVRRSLIALSSSHQTFGFPGKTVLASETLDMVSLREYINALRQLRKYLASADRPCRRTVLISCALLYCVACARGKYADAKTHLQAGLPILRDCVAEREQSSTPNPASQSADVIDSLSQVFSQMHLQATMFDDTGPPSLPLLSSHDEMAQGASWIPEQFQTIVEAQVTLEILQDRLFRFLVFNNQYTSVSVDTIPVSAITEKSELEKQITCWRPSFDTIMRKTHKECLELTKLARNHIVLLAAQQRTMSMLLQGSLQSHGAVSRDLGTDLEELVLLLRSIFEHPVKEAERTPTDVVPHLYLQLAKYRDRDLQSRALSLPTAPQLCEDPLQVHAVVQLVEVLMDIGKEESHALHEPTSPEDGAVEVGANAAAGGLERLFRLLESQKR